MAERRAKPRFQTNEPTIILSTILLYKAKIINSQSRSVWLFSFNGGTTGSLARIGQSTKPQQ
ncbi:hypothetical protein PZE06_10205 [Robertmurraya sp. DFI.2.37]|uniref:hypothetical protein n=1 Tax=Robertmurraya sp. DFI.2.37 TaxID=3031819 RepID=UPI001248842D|nr:hypothetical protein [Robertmurraya sp. DFI.2.37]MDF1508560.1 hypothetical protein [Robertmurraya sp. DFI.2.37]